MKRISLNIIKFKVLFVLVWGFFWSLQWDFKNKTHMRSEYFGIFV